jgi:molecular chaperone GrpE (heat shock protein)
MSNRVKRAWMALFGAGGATAEGTPEAAETAAATELARLRLKLEEKERELARLLGEYEQREEAARRETGRAGEESLGGLIKNLAPTLSQLATLRHMAAGGRDVRLGDVLKLTGKLEDVLGSHGVEVVGEVGAETAFDPTLHQRMSGGDVGDGTRVRVRFPGYRFGGKTPLKAMVSRVGDGPGKGGEE